MQLSQIIEQKRAAARERHAAKVAELLAATGEVSYLMADELQSALIALENADRDLMTARLLEARYGIYAPAA